MFVLDTGKWPETCLSPEFDTYPRRSVLLTLPKLPPLPAVVDPDAWLSHVHGQHFIRKVRQNGTVRIAERSYYIHLNMIGQYVDLCVDAHKQVFVVWHRQQVLKQVSIKGLHKTLLPFEQFATLMCQQALVSTTPSVTSPTGGCHNGALGEVDHPLL